LEVVNELGFPKGGEGSCGTFDWVAISILNDFADPVYEYHWDLVKQKPKVETEIRLDGNLGRGFWAIE